MTEIILLQIRIFGYADLFSAWPACAKPRLAGRRQALGIWWFVSQDMMVISNRK
jgi:hypothetical protein